jgi:hypothetical protein
MERKEKWWAFLSDVVNSFKENGTKIRWWNAKGKRKIVGDRVRNKEILQGFIFLFHLVHSFNRAFSYILVSLRLGYSADVSLPVPHCPQYVFVTYFFAIRVSVKKVDLLNPKAKIEWRKDMSCFIELFPPLRVLVFLFSFTLCCYVIIKWLEHPSVATAPCVNVLCYGKLIRIQIPLSD